MKSARDPSLLFTFGICLLESLFVQELYVWLLLNLSLSLSPSLKSAYLFMYKYVSLKHECLRDPEIYRSNQIFLYYSYIEDETLVSLCMNCH